MWTSWGIRVMLQRATLSRPMQRGLALHQASLPPAKTPTWLMGLRGPRSRGPSSAPVLAALRLAALLRSPDPCSCPEGGWWRAASVWGLLQTKPEGCGC